MTAPTASGPPAPATPGSWLRRAPSPTAVCVATGLAVLVWTSMVFIGPTTGRVDRTAWAYYEFKIVFCFGAVLFSLFLQARPRERALGRELMGWSAPVPLIEAIFTLAKGAGLRGGGAVGLMLCTILAEAGFETMMITLPLWLPDGTLPGRRWGRVLHAAVGVVMLTVVWCAFAPGAPYGLPLHPMANGIWADITSHLAALHFPTMRLTMPLLLTAPALVVMAVRWTRQARARRAADTTAAGDTPIRPWLPKAHLVPLLTAYGVWVLVNWTVELSGITDRGNQSLIFFIAPSLWPLLIGYALVADPTWQVTAPARRSLMRLVMVLGLITTYVLLFLPMSGWLEPASDAQALALSLAALVGGFGLPYAVYRAARTVEQYPHGERARAYQAVRDLAGRLSMAPGPDRAPDLLCTTVVDTLGLPAARVRMAAADGPRTAATRGSADPSHWHSYVLRHEGVEVGSLQVAHRPDETTLDERDDEVLCLLADQAGPSIDFLRLYEDLKESREHIVKMREETRRLLRRDLHDGVAPTLSALRLQVDALQAGRPPGDPVGEQLVKVSEELGNAVVELRRILDGLAPMALDRRGLTEALRELARNLSSRRLRIDTDIAPDPLPCLSAPIEVALYRIVAEALHNVVRHAGASSACAAVRLTDHSVIAEITDNGTGAKAGQDTGIGLRSMNERAAELKGNVVVVPNPSGNGGTLVRAVLPLPPVTDGAEG